MVQGMSADELVAHAVRGAEVDGTGGVALQLLTQLQDMVVHSAGRGIILVSPNFVQQFVTADHPVGILHQKLQGLKFLRGQHYDLAVTLNFHLLEVDRDAVEANEAHISRSSGMPQRCAHAGQQLARTERLSYVIIRSQLEQQNLVGNVAGGAENDDRQSGGQRLDLFAQVAPGKLRQTQVKNNNCGRRCLKAIERSFSIPLHFDGVAFGFEQTLQGLLDGGIVFDYENSPHRPRGAHRINRSRYAQWCRHLTHKKPSLLDSKKTVCCPSGCYLTLDR